jgi:hypothetical protein
MEGKNALASTSAARLAASTFGVLAGLGGIRHGIGEILQGNVAPSGIMIDSWVEGPIATNMGGEPGLTVVPNLLVTGVLALIFSSAVVVWAAAFVQRKNGGWILILLSSAMLLVGGGVGPPIIGILAGVAGLGIGAPLIWWRTRLPVSARRFLAALWPWVFGVAVLNGGFLFVASAFLVFLFGVNNPDLFLNSFFFAVLSLLLTIVTGIAYDIQPSERDAHLSLA